MYPIITISREFGSGGHLIGEKVAKELGLPFYDSEIVDQVAKRSGYAKAVINEQGEYTDKMNKWFSVSVASAMYIENPQDEIFRAQRRVILDCAEQGPCVIVGRCADYILESDEYKTLNVFIHADMEHRKARIAEKYGDEKNLDKQLVKRDRNRKTYYKYYTDREWGNYQNYQLNLDSGYLGIDTCVDMIVKVAQSKKDE
jgi:cytidylate kinase